MVPLERRQLFKNFLKLDANHCILNSLKFRVGK
jgi:hypothetical protein